MVFCLYFRWTHSYKKPGTYEIKGNCTGTSEELIESWIVVEEQVGGLKLEGPKVVEIQGLVYTHIYIYILLDHKNFQFPNMFVLSWYN